MIETARPESVFRVLLVEDDPDHAELRAIPCVVLTTSDAERDVTRGSASVGSIRVRRLPARRSSPRP
jgi:hypothetical protein